MGRDEIKREYRRQCVLKENRSKRKQDYEMIPINI
jgi:hypothetical protein